MPKPPRTRFSDRMSDSDALMWNIEADPALRSTIVSCWVLDRSPDWERFEAKLEIFRFCCADLLLFVQWAVGVARLCDCAMGSVTMDNNKTKQYKSFLSVTVVVVVVVVR